MTSSIAEPTTRTAPARGTLAVAALIVACAAFLGQTGGAPHAFAGSSTSAHFDSNGWQ